MTLGAALRRTGFWWLDRARGGPVRRELEDVTATMSVGRANREELGPLLAHATTTTEFYRPFVNTPFDAFPVIDRATVKARDREFRSSAFAGEVARTKTTSGSTGSPLAVDHDARKRNRTIADTLYFNDVAGLRLGDGLLWMQSWRLHPYSHIELRKQNVVPIDILGMDDAVREGVIRAARRDAVVAILGYPAALDSLSIYIDGMGYRSDDFGLRVIISSAETLHPDTAARIGSAFGCPVVDRYANEECGILACSRPGDASLILNRASYHFEFLALGRDEPAIAGEPARVVVTDLYNRAMPLIRYDTGDVAMVAGHADADVVALDRVDGRRADMILNTRGDPIPAASISYFVSQRLPDVARYQLIQEGPATYRLRVVLGASKLDGSELCDALREVLGPDADISIRFSDEIAAETNGKYRAVINRLHEGDRGPAPT